MEDHHLALLDTDAVLQPLLDAAKCSSWSNISTVRALVMKVLAHPEIFCGYDQLKMLLVNGGSSIEDAALLATLDLFSYGNYASYIESPGCYLSLNEKQLTKLRQLTLLSFVQGACELGQAAVPYASIGEALQLSDQRSMEQVIVSCIYSRVLNGKLCQKNRQLLILDVPVCISRDVCLQKIPILLQQWSAFQERLTTSYLVLEEAHSDVSQSLTRSAAYWQMVQDRQEQAQTEAQNSSAGGGGTVRGAGWPESGFGARRSSASRQSKRSRGGLGGPFSDPFQRY